MLRRTITWTGLVWLSSVALLVAAEPTFPQPPKPTAHHEQLKALEGTWDASMTMADVPQAMPGVMTYKMECDGLWLVSDYKSDAPGFAFQGRGFDGYDAAKQKHVGIWVDSMSTAPMFLEGTCDEKNKVLTMTGECTKAEGGPQQVKTVCKMKDEDHHSFQMFMIDAQGQEKLAFTIEYTRKK